MARFVVLFAALLVPVACNLSLDEEESGPSPGGPPTTFPGGLQGWAGTAGSAGAWSSAGVCPGNTGCAERPAVCLANDECTDGLCVNNRCQSFCTTDAECNAGDACWLGLCRSGAAGFECFGAGDCPDSDDCVGGSCLRRCLNDEQCAGCDDGLVCGVGYCGP